MRTIRETTLPNLMALLLLTFLFANCSTPPTETKPVKEPGTINDQLSYRQIGIGTFVVTDRTFFNSNVLIAAMKDGTVLIASSPFETVGATALIQWVQEKFEPTKIIAVNTHFHGDGTGGNEAYQKAGVEIWASSATRKLHLKNGRKMAVNTAGMYKNPELKKRILARTEVPASNVFVLREGHNFNFGGEEVRVIYPGPAHSPENVVVYLPQRGILFGGCMIKSMDAKDLGFTGHANVPQWPNSAQTILELNPLMVIPGHGEPGGPELIEHTIQMAKARSAATPH